MKTGAAYLASLALGTTAVIAAPLLAQQTDWTKRVTMSKIGGHILGNPLAKHNLVEYVSYTCNHCATFEVQSHTPLKTNYVAKGDVTVEVRNFVRDPIDLTAALLARCGGRKKFFGNHKAIMSAQSNWLQTVQSASKDTQQGWFSGEFTQRMKNIARDVGFYKIMQKRGFSIAQSNVCLADKAAQDKILAMTKYATDTVKITGTPSFTINGQLVAKVHSWPSLRMVLNRLSQ